MAQVSTYLHFARSTEAAFSFYKSVFKTEYVGTFMRFGDLPSAPDQPAMPEADRKLVMHVALPILGGHMLMGTDTPETMGHSVVFGNNSYINLEPDDRAETRRLFDALSEGGKIETPLAEMFWGGFFGSLKDQFGVQWMFNCMSKT